MKERGYLEPKEKAGKVCDFRARKRRAYWVRKRRNASRKALHNEPLKVPPLGREKPQEKNVWRKERLVEVSNTTEKKY